MLTAITGGLSGLFHVLSGPDHLAAVAALGVTTRERGWLVGLRWGIGHASGAVVVAVLAILLRDQLPSVELISAWSERLVGSALIAIGLWVFLRSVSAQMERHAHGTTHQHLHIHDGPGWMSRIDYPRASFCMGFLHGMAGSSHFLGVLPALALPTQRAAFIYIWAFGLGTVVAMTGFAAAIGTIGMHTRTGAAAQRGMMQAAAVVAISVGSWWLIVGQ